MGGHLEEEMMEKESESEKRGFLFSRQRRGEKRKRETHLFDHVHFLPKLSLLVHQDSILQSPIFLLHNLLHRPILRQVQV